MYWTAGLIIVSVMCPPWPRLEPLGHSERQHRTGSSSHKLKQLVIKADCKSSPKTCLSPELTLLAFREFLSEKIIPCL